MPKNQPLQKADPQQKIKHSAPPQGKVRPIKLATRDPRRQRG